MKSPASASRSAASRSAAELGVLVAMWLWSRKSGRNLMDVYDFIAPMVPLAPGLLSTITLPPSLAPMRVPMSRKGLLRSFSTSKSIPMPGSVGKSTKLSLMVSGFTAISSHAGFRLIKHSASQKFGIVTDNCTVAANPTSVEL